LRDRCACRTRKCGKAQRFNAYKKEKHHLKTKLAFLAGKSSVDQRFPREALINSMNVKKGL